MHRITFVKGGLCGRTFEIGETSVYVGRSRDCEIRIPDEVASRDVSRKHLLLVSQGGALLAVNMRSRQTLLDGSGMPPNHKAELTPGMRVTLGAGTEFRVLEPGAGETPVAAPRAASADPGASATFATVATSVTVAPCTDAGQTGELIASVTGAREDAVGKDDDAPFVAPSAPEEAPAAEISETPEALASGGGRRSVRQGPPADEPAGGTVPARTVPISAGELALLIEVRRRKRLLRTYRRVGFFVGGFLAIAVAYLCLRPHPEKVLTWQRRADGTLDRKQILFTCALGTNAFGAWCPRDSRMRVHTSSNGVTVVDTYVGRDRDVPLRLEFACEKNPAYLRMSRDQLFDAKRRQLEEAGGWNVLALSPLVFLGFDNGMPCREIQYLRSGRDSRQWFGHLIFAVHGDCALTFTREIPALEQWRGGSFLARATMLLFGHQILDGHWEGRTDFRNEPEDSMLAEVDGLLSRNSPLLWKDAEFLLQSILIKSGGRGPSFDEALKRLVRLRSAQRMEFNRLKALAQAEKSFGKSKRVSPALEEALRVFSSPDDKRSVLLKKGRWK